MANATFEDHPTDPDKVILRKKPRIDQGPDYERGFIDGMQYQMQSSVDKAVNAMAQPEQERTGSCPLDDCDGGPKTHGCWAHHCEWKAQPEQEPVAWLYIEPDNPHLNVHYDDVDVSQFPHDEWFPVYRSPPQRTWVGLTDEDKQNAFDDTQEGGGFWEFADAIEAKLKEKNT